MAYMMNTENTGLRSDAQVVEAVRFLSALGYDVEFTRDCGLVNPSLDFPVRDDDWAIATALAASMAPVSS